MKLHYLSLIGMFGCGPKVSNLESTVNPSNLEYSYEDCGVEGTLPFTVYVLLQVHRGPGFYVDEKGLRSQVAVSNELRRIISEGSASVVLIEGLVLS